MEIDAGDWKIFSRGDLNEDFSETYVNLRFALKNNPRGLDIKKEDLEQLIKDLQDLGKWRKFRELKKDLEKDG